jgi:peptide deformylase
MALLEILVAPHPVLAARARPVRADEFGPALARLAAGMAETMYEAPGVGLAAPQVGDSRRLIVLDPSERKQRGTRLFRMANPEIVDREGAITWNETCLSVPDVAVDVDRSFRVRARWQEPEDGSVREGWFQEYEAVIVQHEIDHLEGTVILDRVSFFKRSRYLKRLRARRSEQELAL